MSKLATHQKEFINLLISAKALRFGDFTTKSGRKTPYFINAGIFNSSIHINELGKLYATHIVKNQINQPDLVFGPAYKGIPLSITTTINLHTNYGINSAYSFDRKEAKEHGDKGNFVGKTIEDNNHLVIVEDVVTAGTTLKHIVPVLRKTADIIIDGVIIAVDRCERGSGEKTAVKELESLLDIKIYPIVTIYEILEHLSTKNDSGFTLSLENITAINSYLKEHGSI